MLALSIMGFKNDIELHHLVVDLNGTLAIDGRMINGVKDILIELSGMLQIHVLTGNTLGTADEELKDIPCEKYLLPQENQDFEKGKYVLELGQNSVIAIGNGNNDRSMLKVASIGIVLIQKEGAAIETLMSADIVCTNIIDALDLIQNPLRLKSTLRS
jgi:soluble P-type ATPase